MTIVIIVLLLAVIYVGYRSFKKSEKDLELDTPAETDKPVTLVVPTETAEKDTKTLVEEAVASESKPKKSVKRATSKPAAKKTPAKKTPAKKTTPRAKKPAGN